MGFQFFATAAILLSSSCTAFQAPSSSSIRFIVDSSPSTSQNHLASPSRKAATELRGGALSLSPEALRLAETLAPKVGILTSSALYFAPAAAVLAAIRSNDIGELNPLPLAIMSIVSVAWLAYGLAANDPYVALSNIAGCVGAIGYVVGILPLLQNDKSVLRMTQGVIMAGSATMLSMWTFLGLSGASASKISSVLGMFASALFIILSGSPLSTIGKVIKTKNSASILGSFTAAQVVNTSLWSVYGLAVKNRFVWGPNVVVRIPIRKNLCFYYLATLSLFVGYTLQGLGLGLVQLLLKVVFPAKSKS
jgi:solute carrier family 50 protein (sugar transporter)